MMMRRWLHSDSARDRLRKTCIALGASVGLAAAFFLFNLQQAIAAKNEAETMIAGQKKRLAELNQTVDRSKGFTFTATVPGVDTIASFQAFVEQSAASKNCSVDEFVASRDVAAYLSRYEKDTTETGWMQVLVKTRVQGRAADVVAVLHSLKNSGVTFEFCSMEILRQSVLNDKETEVSALVELNVLIQPDGGTS